MRQHLERSWTIGSMQSRNLARKYKLRWYKRLTEDA